MKKYLIAIAAVAFLASCEEEKKQDPFLISKGALGKLTKEATVAELDSIFANDSLVKRIGEGDYVQAGNDLYTVFEKGGKKLYTLTPKQQHDTDETIETIQIFDDRLKTAKGINLSSTFKEIKANHKISKIENTLRNVVVFVDEVDAYFTIDKKYLDAKFRNDSGIKIDTGQIPDHAKVKFFMIGWE